MGRVPATVGAEPAEAELDVDAAGADVDLRHHEEAASGGSRAFVIGLQAEGGFLRLAPEEGVVAEEGLAVDAAAFGTPAGHGEGAPLGMEADTGEIEGVGLPVGLAASDLADTLPAVDELRFPGTRKGSLERGFVGGNALIFERQFEFDTESVGEGVFDFGSPLEGAVRFVADERIDFEFATLGAEGANEVEDERLRDAREDARERSFIGVLSGKRRGGEETHYEGFQETPILSWGLRGDGRLGVGGGRAAGGGGFERTREGKANSGQR